MLVQLAVFVCLYAASANGLTTADCPAGLPRDAYLQTYGDFCYEFVLYRSVEYDEAQQYCAKDGGFVVEIFDSGIQTFLQSQLLSHYHETSAIWIGLTDHNADNLWEWSRDGTITSYDNWAAGQPGNLHSLGFEECAAMEVSKGGEWHDYRCTDLLFLSFGHKFVCQYGPFKNTSILMSSLMPAMSSNMPSSAMPAMSSNMPSSAMPAMSSNMPSSAMPAMSSNMPSSAMPAMSSNMPSSAMPAMSSNMPSSAMSDMSSNMPSSSMPAMSSSMPNSSMPAMSSNMPSNMPSNMLTSALPGDEN